MLKLRFKDSDAPGKGALALALLTMAVALTSCGGAAVYKSETFESDSPYYRAFDATVDAACGACRSALLSQGYIITERSEAGVKASKQFQPDEDIHNDLDVTITCEQRGARAVVYANAVQQRYEVKKSSQATTLSLSKLGSLSLPGSSVAQELIKTGSETVTDPGFYERFFALVANLLAPVPPQSR